MHIAGHGVPPARTASPAASCCRTARSSAPTEIAACGTVPELVFVNCCHLARADAGAVAEATSYDRAEFASGVAGALIAIGVRCVIAAGWAVDDDGGHGCSPRRSTGQLLRRKPIHRRRRRGAPGSVRQSSRRSNTWAAYSATAIPTGRYRRETQDAQRPDAFPDPAQEFASIASASALVLALETLAVKSEFQHADSAAQADRLRYLQETYARFWSDNGQVAEAFGNAWAKAGDFEEAVGGYEQARTAADGTSPLTAIEQLANLKVRIASARAAGANAAEAAVQAAARKDITEAMSLLDILLAVVRRSSARASTIGLQAARVHRRHRWQRRRRDRRHHQHGGALHGGRAYCPQEAGKESRQDRERVLRGDEQDRRTTRAPGWHGTRREARWRHPESRSRLDAGHAARLLVSGRPDPAEDVPRRCRQGLWNSNCRPSAPTSKPNTPVSARPSVG